MDRPVVLSFSFDELTALCVSLQRELGFEVGDLTSKGRLEREALLGRLNDIWCALDDLQDGVASNEALPLVDQVRH